ncbi:nucleotidyltransferase family protein [Clostridium sp. YIM B02515]|uniref:Nucleotidyltransferase family protein n=1 Tax=Clostridium rhizosphaerae TaxID=2803861 RepID=A0ABS1TFN0_9CLOT|nr:nucleotidyltransferase family protein [Clostridium rhizosphaerae]MBL4938135.1 nucleotidyltransferase family protein [Clostridium rhizosphaerae]
MAYLDNLLVTEQTTIIETLKKIDSNAKGIAIVVSDNKELIGTITDGDIRRAIIDGAGTSSTITKIYNKKCKYLLDNYDKKDIENIFKNDKIRFIPIIDQYNVVIDLLEVDNDNFSVYRDNPVLIMAGGLGTRLRPLTNDLPKPMLKVGGKPILETIIEQFKIKGYKNILLSVNYKSEIIENYFRDGSDFGVSIKYIREDKRMGTAGAIKLAEQFLNKDFFVINGDILTNVCFNRLLEYHQQNNFKMTIGARNYETQIPYGVLNIDDTCVTSIEEKPIVNFYVNGGIYVLSPDTLKYIPENDYFDITELINKVLENKDKVGSYPILEYWMDIGQLKDYYKANEDIKKYF